MLTSAGSCCRSRPLRRLRRTARPSSLPTRRTGAFVVSSHAQRAKATVAVGISGGVDSSVTALLLKRQGFDVIGVHMLNWKAEEEEGQLPCVAEKDERDARLVCDSLGIPFQRAEFVKEYWQDVFEPCLVQYSAGHTPNFDVLCNRHIKFGAFRDLALGMGADFIATGHYARVAASEDRSDAGPEGSPRLLWGLDPAKDQSYFLCQVRGEQLRRVLMPLGDVRSKAHVRKLARECGLPTWNRRDSTGLCFVGARRFDGLLSDFVSLTPGELRCIDTGHLIGRHRGVELYTVGQGVKFGGAPGKLFVARKDMDTATIYVAMGTEHPALFADGLEVEEAEMSWVAGARPEVLANGGSMTVSYKIRHAQARARGTVRCLGGGRLALTFGVKERGVATRQIVALYSPTDEICLGGGPIAAPIFAPRSVG
jgi:tRNA (5-methylaminomethyl-2-thiouridylate)-methyltransferase